MFNLISKLETLVVQAKDHHAAAMLDCDWTDTIAAYYRNDIIERFEEYKGVELDEDQQERFIDCLVYKQDSILFHDERAFSHQRENEFAIASYSELEFELPNYIKRHPAFFETINRFTDIYVNRSGYGYVDCDYGVIAIDFDALDDEDITTILKG